MNKSELVSYLEKIDSALNDRAILYIYGSGACMLLDEPDRTSLDLDVAGSYSRVDEADLRKAADSAGIPVNPDESYQGNHIEWIGPLRLCLQPPTKKETMILWQGTKLTIETASIPNLIASKLIRYDEIDQGDIQYLLSQGNFTHAEIVNAASNLPAQFANDQMVKKNLINLEIDMKIWGDTYDRP
jgi:hypothetical protein